MEDICYNVMILHALGDTIGFKNGDWEFNYHEIDKLLVLDYVNELIYEFIDLGGVNGIDLSKWKISDDTYMHIAIGKSMLQYNGKLSKKFISIIKDNLKIEVDRLWDENDPSITKNPFNRYIGHTTSYSVDKFTDDFDARNDVYNDYGGGNGAAMRNLIIGICLFGEKNRQKLIELSIISSQLTHNNALGYLGGFNSALFAAYAVEKIPMEEWGFGLIEYLKSNQLKSYLSLDNLDQIYDHNSYIRYWQKYLDTKFDKHKKPLKTRANANPMHRIRYFYENFFRGTASDQIGSSGYLCMIMAYDALLDCDGKWEKLIVYAILHSGDSDTVGAIAGGLYGAVYGLGDVPKHMFMNIERKEELKELSEKLQKKYLHTVNHN